MKQTNQLILIIIIILLTSCNNTDTHNNTFEYNIQGSVKNGDSIYISLYIPDRGLDNRQTTQILNGKYNFKGYAENNGLAYLKFETDIVNPGNISCILNLFIEKDTVVLNFEIDTLDFGLCFKNREYEKGRNILYLSNNQNKLISEPIYTYSDPLKRDSMKRYVYPEIRKTILTNYQKYFHKNEYHIVSLYYLDYIINNLRDLFDTNQLTVEEKEKLQQFLADIDTSLHHTKTYLSLKNSMINLIENKDIVYKDFSLIDINGDSIEISKIISKKEFTILYFWWSMCQPCRNFINNTVPNYNRIKEKNIEVISINTDQSKNLWKEISKKDGINWTNLYAGDISEIASYYDVVYFPRIFIFDKDFNLISDNYQDLETLIKK